MKKNRYENTIRFSVALMLLTLVFSCVSMKSKNEISGKVESIESGKDGYTAKINTTENKIYFATISIVNLGGPENFKRLNVGEEVFFKGEIWKTETDNHMTVKEIVSVK